MCVPEFEHINLEVQGYAHKSCLLKCLSLLKLGLTFGTYNTLNTKGF